jgi:FixJ family two-component response regulator
LTAESLTSQSDDVIAVYIIDDDESTRCALARLMRSANMRGIPHASVEEFLESDFEPNRACIVADVHMPENDTLSLPESLQKIGAGIPVIFMTADYSVNTRERIRKAGGRGYFGKPVDDQALLDMIRWAVRST